MMPKNKHENPAASSRKSVNGVPSTSRNTKSEPGSSGVIWKMASKVFGIFSKSKTSIQAAVTSHDVELPLDTEIEAPKAPRLTKRTTDIPMDQIENAYVPTQTSLKSGFRDDGSDRHSSQEFASGTSDDRWNDEDHYTNKSEDPRIGTRGRTYEPGEARDKSRE